MTMMSGGTLVSMDPENYQMVPVGPVRSLPTNGGLYRSHLYPVCTVSIQTIKKCLDNVSIAVVIIFIIFCKCRQL